MNSMNSMNSMTPVTLTTMILLKAAVLLLPLLTSPLLFVSAFVPVVQKCIINDMTHGSDPRHKHKRLNQIKQYLLSNALRNDNLSFGSAIGVSNNNHIDENSFLFTESTKTSLNTMLDKMIQYFGSMVDPNTNQFFLMSYPQLSSDDENCRLHQQCSLRELGCAWDATTALHCLLSKMSDDDDDSVAITKEKLRDVILETIKKYSTLFITSSNNGATLHSDILKEMPNIAHNGLFLLTLIGIERLVHFNKNSILDLDEIIKKHNTDELARGILCMQREDGAFRTYFRTSLDSSIITDNVDDNDDDDNVCRGIEFFSGEAMTSLLEIYSYCVRKQEQQSPPSSYFLAISDETKNQILPAMKRALHFYRSYYNQGRQDGTVDVNYTIWQVQAFSRLFFALLKEQQKHNNNYDKNFIVDSASYCLDMCNDIIRSTSWRMLSRGKSFYPNLSTIEIACGLDALVQGTRVAYHYHRLKDEKDVYDEHKLFVRNVENAIDFLQWSQDQIMDDEQVGYGGLGFGGVYVTEQRLDITGHALSAIHKLLKSEEEEML